MQSLKDCCHTNHAITVPIHRLNSTCLSTNHWSSTLVQCSYTLLFWLSLLFTMELLMAQLRHPSTNRKKILRVPWKEKWHHVMASSWYHTSQRSVTLRHHTMTPSMKIVNWSMPEAPAPVQLVCQFQRLNTMLRWSGTSLVHVSDCRGSGHCVGWR